MRVTGRVQRHRGEQLRFDRAPVGRNDGDRPGAGSETGDDLRQQRLAVIRNARDRLFERAACLVCPLLAQS